MADYQQYDHSATPSELDRALEIARSHAPQGFMPQGNLELPKQAPSDVRNATWGNILSAAGVIPASVAGTIYGLEQSGGRMRGAAAGSLLGAAAPIFAGTVLDAVTGNAAPALNDPRRGQVPLYMEADDTYLPNGSWVPELKLPKSAPIHPPGTLSPVYDKIDAVSSGVSGWLADARKTAEANGVKGGAAARGQALYDLVLNGIPSLASSVAKIASAPIDYFRGHSVDAGVGDVANVALAGYGGKKLREPASDKELPQWMYPSLSDNDAAIYAAKQKADDAAIYKDLLKQTKQEMDSISYPLKGYRGSTSNEQRFRNGHGLWSSDKPEIANTYARTHMDYGDANVMPLDITFKNPLIYTAKGAPEKYHTLSVNGKYTNTDALVDLAKRHGHDGVIFRNILDAVYGGEVPSQIYKSIGRGTTKSSITGDLLYGIAPYATGAAGAAVAPGVLLRDQIE